MPEALNPTEKRRPVYFLGGLAALIVGFAGQLLLGSNQLPAAISYLFAVALIILAFRKQSGPQVELAAFQPIKPGNKSRWGYAVLGSTMVMMRADAKAP